MLYSSTEQAANDNWPKVDPYAETPGLTAENSKVVLTVDLSKLPKHALAELHGAVKGNDKEIVLSAMRAHK